MFRFLAQRILLFIAIAVAGYLTYALYVWFVPIHLTDKIVFNIPPGQRGYETLQLLQKNHIVRDPFLAGVYLSLTGKEGLIRSGNYTFSGSFSLVNVIATLTNSHQAAPEVTLTFREGLTRQEMADYLQEQGHPAASLFMSASEAVPRQSYIFLRDLPQAASLEGFLFPDTYRVYPDATPSDIIGIMLENFDHKLSQDLRTEIARQKKSIFQIITMASILEKEVPSDSDRAIVAGIFYKRLAQGMRLQSDATVNYVTGKQMAQPTYADTAIDSLYNTYTHGGLPPGPISNPGLSAIKAAIYPKTSPYLFFLTTKDGRVIYSKTYDEHLANKHKYL